MILCWNESKEKCMKEYLAFNADRIIWYDESDRLIEEWTGGTFQISDINVRKSTLYINGRIESKFVPQIEKIDVSINVPASDYALKWEKISENKISIKLEFEISKLKEKRFGIEVFLYGNAVKADIDFDKKQYKKRFKEKKFIYVGKDWMFAQRKKKLIEIVPNTSKIGKIKAMIANTLF